MANGIVDPEQLKASFEDWNKRVAPRIISRSDALTSGNISSPYKTLNEYDQGLLPGMNQEYVRGYNQRGWGQLPTAIGRFVGSTVLKTLESISALPNPIEGNALSREIAEAERSFLDEVLPIYRTPEMDSDSLAAKLREPGWWASTFVDGAAFMASAVIGAKGINAASKFASIGRIAKALGASDDVLMGMGRIQRSAVGRALSLDNFGVNLATGVNAYTESSFEARHLIDDLKEKLAKEKYNSSYDFLDESQKQDVMNTAGEAGRQVFWHNLPMLMVTEKIFNETIIGNFFGLPNASAMGRLGVEGGQVITKGLTKGQKAALLGLPVAVNIGAESMQENYQLAVQNYFTKKALGQPVTSIMEEMSENFRSAEGKESMFLGGLLGGAGGATGAIRNFSKEEAAANEYVDILNKGLNQLNTAGHRLFQTDENGSVKLDENKQPLLKTPEQIQKEYDSLQSDFDKYLYSNVIKMMEQEGSLSAKELTKLDRDNSFADFIMPFFEVEGGKEIANKLLEQYAEKIKTEYKQELDEENKDADVILKELKDKMTKMEDMYHLAGDYYALSKFPESKAVQYKSLFKQDYYRNRYNEEKANLGKMMPSLNENAATTLTDVLEGNKKIKDGEENTFLKSLMNGVDETKLPAGQTARSVADTAAKVLSYKSLFESEKDMFKEAYTKEKWYEEIRDRLDAEKKAKEEADTAEAARKAREEKIRQEEAAKKQAQQPPATPAQVTPVNQQGTAPTAQNTASATGTTGTPATVTGQGVIRVGDEVTEKRNKSKENILNELGNKPAMPTTVARKLGITNEEAKELLDELVAEGKVVPPVGKGKTYSKANDSSEARKIESQGITILKALEGKATKTPEVERLIADGILEEVDGKIKIVNTERGIRKAIGTLAFYYGLLDKIPFNITISNEVTPEERSNAQEELQRLTFEREATFDKLDKMLDAVLAQQEEAKKEEETEDFENPDLSQKEIDNLQNEIDKRDNEDERFYLITEGVRVAFNKIANRVISMVKAFSAGVVQRYTPKERKEDVMLPDAVTAYMSSKVVRGKELTIRVADDYVNTPTYTDRTYTTTEPFSERMKRVSDGNVNAYTEELVNNLPLAIYDGDVLLGYVHRVDYVDTDNVAETDLAVIASQQKILHEFRKQFVDENGNVKTSHVVNTKVNSVSNGKLLRVNPAPISSNAPNQPVAVISGKGKVKIFGQTAEVPLQHSFDNGTVGILATDRKGNKVFLPARRKSLSKEEKQSLKDKVKSKERKLKEISSKVFVITTSSTDTMSIQGSKIKTPNRLVLGINANGYMIYDRKTKTVYSNNEAKLDEYFEQDLKANADFRDSSPENKKWIQDNYITNIAEVEVNHGGDVEHTVFVHNVVRFDMPIKRSEEVRPVVVEEQSLKEAPKVDSVGVEAKKAEIERRRQEERASKANTIETKRTEYTDSLGDVYQIREYEDGHTEFWKKTKTSSVFEKISSDKTNTFYTKEYLESLENETLSDAKSIDPPSGRLDKINAKYDAELKALEAEETTAEETKVTDKDKIKAIEKIDADIAELEKRKEEALSFFYYDNVRIGDTFNVKFNWSENFETLTLFAKSKDGRAWLIGENKKKATWKNLKDFKGDRLEYSKNTVDRINAEYNAQINALKEEKKKITEVKKEKVKPTEVKQEVTPTIPEGNIPNSLYSIQDGKAYYDGKLLANRRNLPVQEVINNHLNKRIRQTQNDIAMKSSVNSKLYRNSEGNLYRVNALPTGEFKIDLVNENNEIEVDLGTRKEPVVGGEELQFVRNLPILGDTEVVKEEVDKMYNREVNAIANYFYQKPIVQEAPKPEKKKPPKLGDDFRTLSPIVTPQARELVSKCNNKISGVRIAKKGLVLGAGTGWSLVQDFKGMPSHKQGGVDIKLGADGFSFVRDGAEIKAKYGLRIDVIN